MYISNVEEVAMLGKSFSVGAVGFCSFGIILDYEVLNFLEKVCLNEAVSGKRC